MFRNCLAAALRNLSRNRLYALISLAGLAVGMCVALMVVLVIRNQYTFDHDVPGYERTYAALVAMTPPGLAKQYLPVTLLDLAAQLEQQSPAIEAASRVLEGGIVPVEYGNQTAHEMVYWADANLPKVLPSPASAGDVAAALRRPDGVVLSHSYARRFFGLDAPLGETLVIDGHPLLVEAVMRDPPLNSTDQRRDIIASGVAAFSPNRGKLIDAQKLDKYSIKAGVTYLRLKPGASISALAPVVSHILRAPGPNPFKVSVELVRIDRINTYEDFNPGFHARMLMLAILGAVVLLIAAINFVNLQTACSALRAREVAIRGLSGAGRSTLIAQFLGEALAYALVAAMLAVALSEWVLPRVNSFLDTGGTLDYGREPWLLAALLGGTLIVGLLAGAWPALVLSGFRPAAILRGIGGTGGGALIREGLVTLQFALLITLAICCGVVYRQREFAMDDALRMQHDQVLVVYAPEGGAFADEVRRLPGVRALTRASLAFLGTSVSGQPRAMSVATGHNRSGQEVSINVIDVDFDLFDFYGIRPLAGNLPAVGAPRHSDSGYVVLNDTAVRKYELGPTAQAVGKAVPIGTPASTLLAIVPDFSLNSIDKVVPPTAYFQQQDDKGLDVLSVRLTGHDIPETLTSIDRLWTRMGHPQPPLRFFLDEQIQRTYQSVLRQSQAFGICALIALALSCIGLFALTAATAERRTKEIGIRKSLGADTRDVVKLLLWQFSKPVVWANLIAWPAAAFVMSEWLAAFAYHISLPLWLFPAAAVAALLIALTTVSAQSIRIARARPFEALRYE